MNQFCLIGHPLGHSISPKIHERLFDLSNIPGEYFLKDLPCEIMDDEIKNLRQLCGFNVTIPYKQTIIPYLDSVDSRAAQYNAVNTVKCENGKLLGYNTDVSGFLKSLEFAGIELKGHVLLCGAGGVAHMMACEALENGCSLVIATPTLSEAQNCADGLLKQYKTADISTQGLSYVSGSFDLILNGTPAGMYPSTAISPVAKNVARSAKAVFDAVYNPCETLLIKHAKSAGVKAQGGLAMLVLQAAAAQEIWTGVAFGDGTLKALIKEMELYIELNFQK